MNFDLLNEEQKEVFEELLHYIQRKSNEIYVLKGYAGTGKTFCISVLLNHLVKKVYLKNRHYRIAVTGPTNKAVNVIENSSNLIHPRIEFKTIHRLLGLREKITEDGRQEFVNESWNKSDISRINLLIIDEVSMLNDDLFHKIITYRNKLKIICMGDPAQIPPVGKDSCIPFNNSLLDQYNIKTLELKTPMRQKEDNMIISISSIIRNNLYSNTSNLIPPISKLNNEGEGATFINLNDKLQRKNFSSLLKNYFCSKNFEIDPDYVKIIAWRNSTVDLMNNLVRKLVFGDIALSEKILKDDRLIANTPIIDGDEIIFNTNEEFIVMDYTIKEYKYKDILGESILKYYDTKVYFLNINNKKVTQNIKILHEESQYEFNNIANNLKRKAIQGKGTKILWVNYYNFLRKFADVKFSYAITAHKSQGSTYKNVFIMEDDIEINHKIYERNRIKYTAYTRASNKIYILKKFNKKS